MRTRRLLFSLVLALGLTLAVLAGLGQRLPRVRADTYTVTNTNASGAGSLRQAILDANGNTGHDTISFGVSGAIVLTDALPIIGDDLSITGPGADQLDVSGANTYRVFTINSGVAVTITGVTVRDGSADYGGGVWSVGDLRLGAVRILSNSATYNGGGVYVSDGSATLSGTQVVSNSASDGGGVYVSQGSVTLNGTQVVSNSASDGGGVYVSQGSAMLNRTQVVSNSAADYGGGVYVSQGSATLSGTQVVGNSASGFGGGVCVWGDSATLSVSGGRIDSNSAHNGGGMYVYEGSATLSGTHVVSNSASTSGGGVYVDQGGATLSVGGINSNSAYNGGGVYVRYGSATLSGTQVVSNSASNNGGGVYVRYGSAMLNVSGGEVGSNSAAVVGGGVYVEQGSATLNGAQVVSNSASWYGGGMYVSDGSATLSGTQVVSNVASAGGGVYVSDGSATLRGTPGVPLQVVCNSAYNGGGVYVRYGSATLSGTQVVSNSAITSGGGVYVSEGSATLTGTQVVSNSASEGGGVYVNRGSATLSVSGGEVSSNSVITSGGGVYVWGGSATLSGTQVVRNSANNGGGMYVYDGSARLSETQVVSNSANDAGGGVLVWYGSATLNVSRGKISSNSADYGGGVYVEFGSATLSGTQVVSNSAAAGGGVFVVQGGATLSAGEVGSNSASGNGGGVYVLDGSATVSGTRVISNSADYGGGLYVEQGSATLSGTQVVSNLAAFGGGVYVGHRSATLYVSGGEVVSNSASDRGGGVYVEQGIATVSGTRVVSNSAFDSGGGLYVEQGSATLNGMQVVSNLAGAGGGVYVFGGSATLSGTQVVSNSTEYGGGVYVSYGSATLNGTQVVGNSASSFGGGVYISSGGAMLDVSGGVIDSNSANYGGGVYVSQGSAMLNGTRVVGNSASYNGGGVYVSQGSATLSGTQITANDAPDGSALSTGGTINPTTALTITGDIYQAGGRFAGSSHDLRIQGSLSLAGGDFYAPDTPNEFVLSGPFIHTGGVYHQTQLVNGSDDVGFPGAGGVILNANGQDLGSTEVALTAGVDCAGVPAGEAVRHCYEIAPTNTSGRDAVITFFYRTGERFPGHACAAMEAYRWSGAWDTPLTRDGGYGSAGRLCGAEPQSLRVTGVSTFSLFVLRGPAADARISKVVTPTVAAPGQAITYTLIFSNAGFITATGVVISDTIPVSVTSTSVIRSGAVITRRGDTRYVWDVADLVQSAGGVITITGVLSNPLAVGVLTNTAAITTTAIDSDAGNNTCSAGITVVAPEITVHPWNLAFGSQDVDAGATVSQTVTITNDGSADLHVSSVSLAGAGAGEFVIASDTGEATLTPGSTRTVRVSFDPATTGIKSASLTVQSDDSDEPTVDVGLSGTGTDQEITVAPGSLAFGDQEVDAGATVLQTVTITNDGSADLHISSVSLTGGGAGEFVIESDTAETTLTPGSTRTVRVSFDPATTGIKAAGLTVQSDDGDEPSVDVALSGTGIDQEITVVPGSLAFGSQDVDVGATVSQAVTITNDGTADLHVSSVSLTGAGAGEFAIASDTGEVTLVPGGTRTVRVSFDPAITGARSASLTIQSDDGDEPSVDVILSGTGTSVADTYTLTVSKGGAGSGTVSSTPAGIDCGAVCQAGFTNGRVVTLTAAAAGSSIFAGWAGEGCSGTGACQVTMDAVRQVTAIFDLAAGQPGYGSTPAPGSRIDVGKANVGSTVSTTLTISETGDMTLLVTPTLSGADAADFNFAPTTLTVRDGGVAQDLTIGCTPSVSGTLAATLTVAHNAPGSPAVYPLSCSGVAFDYAVYLPVVVRDD